ncbi:hydrogenase expression/formation protein [Antarcticimicrobium sediminis]|uniref:Hydrogenase expression/formation protein n=1 Tax=Antarcticimicrobium sediminis TaxID=2546227 RepID=A0A4R5EZ05_9RHOB|nr:hydrogenase expression/formation protein [Antarcticimicrobium sediminis]TDE40281.1 hydrogenase expression/formation protein [Antarcticimicrobium sediminis]
MVNNFQLPPVGFGPGSQPPEEDGAELEFLPMPQDMRTYTTHLPEVEVDDHLNPALDLLAQIAAACATAGETGQGAEFDLSILDAANRALIAETMGAGEVAMKLHGIPAIAIQESVFAGVWMLKAAGMDVIEVGDVPHLVRVRAFEPRKQAGLSATPRQPGVVNAPPLLVELMDRSARLTPGAEVHVVNLTLLPHTEQDLDWLDEALGQGAGDILSRGYGNCRVTATALVNVWRVQFFNSMDTLILDTFEVTEMPEVALAAAEDLVDSGERIQEVLEAIQ